MAFAERSDECQFADIRTGRHPDEVALFVDSSTRRHRHRDTNILKLTQLRSYVML